MNIPKPSDMLAAQKNHNVVDVEEGDSGEAFACMDAMPELKIVPKKKLYTPKPHLTQRPLKNNPGLLSLKERLNEGGLQKWK